MRLPRLPRIPVLAVVALGLGSFARAEGVRIVRAPELGSFPTIQAAVDAATDGDVLLVGEGTYAGFTIADKSLTVIALPGLDVTVEGTVEVRDLAAGRAVLVSGLQATGAMSNHYSERSDPGLRVTASEGHARFQACTFRGGESFPDPLDGGLAGHGVVVEQSPRVAFVACDLLGGQGYSPGFGCAECVGGDGGVGVVSDSDLALYDCDVRGGHGGDTGYLGGKGGSGLELASGTLFAAGCDFTGGDGGDADDFLVAIGGDGGHGLVVTGGEARLRDNTYLGGAGGDSYLGPQYDGDPGQGVVNVAGVITDYPFAARALAAEVLHADQSSATIAVEGEPGDTVFLVWSAGPDFGFSRSLKGARLVLLPFLMNVQPLGTIGGSGTLAASLLLPDVTGYEVLHLQGLVVTGAGKSLLGSPLHLAVLDRAAAPDCNANAASDFVDLLEATSADCDGDVVPDECAIAGGDSEDCNANGVPDECDLASGASLDWNGNGVPDECEGGITWYVDAAAAPGGDGSTASPFQTIAEGIAASVHGNTIVVRDGVYTGPGNRDLDTGQRDVVLRSENGPLACTIDCEGLGSAFELTQPQGSIEGFTIRNGDDNFGGGIETDGGDVTIRDCRILDCTANHGGGIYADGRITVENCFIANCDAPHPISGLGGGIYINLFGYPGGRAVLRENVIVGCSALEGGGIWAYSRRTILISHCSLIDNVATARGGGLWVESEIAGAGDEGGFVHETRFLRNSANRGGAIHLAGSRTHAVLAGCSLHQNTAAIAGGGLFLRGDEVPFLGDVSLVNCVLWGDTAPAGPEVAFGTAAMELAVSYSDVEGGLAAIDVGTGGVVHWGAGNIDADPLFLNDHLVLGALSPCIDAGDNASIQPDRTDVDGDGDVGEPVPLDVLLAPRRVDVPAVPDTGNGTAPIVDMGATERRS